MAEAFFIFYALSVVLGSGVILDCEYFSGGGVIWGDGVYLGGGYILGGGDVLFAVEFSAGGVILGGGVIMGGKDIFYFLCFISSFGWRSHFGCRRRFRLRIDLKWRRRFGLRSLVGWRSHSG